MDLLPRKEYLASLSRKVSSAWALFLDEDWRVLLLETTYKDKFEIPGWVIEENETPRLACKREVEEELWIEVKGDIWELLVCEYKRMKDFECYAFVFFWWVLSRKDIDSFNLCTDEIKSYHFIAKESFNDNIDLSLKNRLVKSIEAREKDTIFYYETDCRWKR